MKKKKKKFLTTSVVLPKTHLSHLNLSNILHPKKPTKGLRDALPYTTTLGYIYVFWPA